MSITLLMIICLGITFIFFIAQTIHKENKDERYEFAVRMVFVMAIAADAICLMAMFSPKKTVAKEKDSETSIVHPLVSFSAGDTNVHIAEMSDDTVHYGYKEGEQIAFNSVPNDKTMIASGNMEGEPFVVATTTYYRLKKAWFCFYTIASAKDTTYTFYLP